MAFSEKHDIKETITLSGRGDAGGAATSGKGKNGGTMNFQPSWAGAEDENG